MVSAWQLCSKIGRSRKKRNPAECGVPDPKTQPCYVLIQLTYHTNPKRLRARYSTANNASNNSVGSLVSRLPMLQPGKSLLLPLPLLLPPLLLATSTTVAAEATALFHKHRIDELPVVDVNNRPVGLIDVQDIVTIKVVG